MKNTSMVLPVRISCSTASSAFLIKRIGRNHLQPGDPKKGVQAMLDAVRSEGAFAGKPIPVVLGLGSDMYETVKKILSAKLEQQEELKEVMFSTDIVE